MTTSSIEESTLRRSWIPKKAPVHVSKLNCGVKPFGHIEPELTALRQIERNERLPWKSLSWFLLSIPTQRWVSQFGYLITRAFGGEATPDGRFNGADVKNPV